MSNVVATRRRRVPASIRLRRIALIAGCVVLFCIAVAAAAHDAIERAWLQRTLAGALDADVTVGALHHEGASIELDGLAIRLPSGAAAVADHVSYRVDHGVWQIAPTGLRVSVPRAALSDANGERFLAAAHDLGARAALVRVRDAEIDLVAADGGKLVEIAGISGAARTGTAPAIHLSATYADAVAPLGAAPITAETARLDGRVVQTVRAGAIPLAGLGAWLGGNGIAFHGGTAHDVAATIGRDLRITMRVDDANVDLGDVTLAHVAGPLTIVGDGLGSSRLDATLLPADVPLVLTGEVHDVADWTSGSRDLRMLSAMIGRIAAQPNLRWSDVETTAPGIVYGQYAMTTKDVPHVVQMLAIDPHEPTVHLNTALSDDHVISKGARTSDLAVRTHAVAGMNGDYFDIGRTYEPQGLLITSGTLLHGPTDHEAVVIDKQNRPTFARFRLRGRVVDGARSFPVTLYNSWPTRDTTIMTPDYGATIPAAPDVTFVALTPVDGTKYRVTSVRRVDAPIPATFGIGISDRLGIPPPRPGDVVDLTWAIDPPVDGVVAGVGSGPLLLKDGQWYEDTHAPAPDERDVQWPVDAIATLSDGMLMLVAVDGRHPDRSIGMTRPEFGELLQRLGGVDAMALDSGGSVTMVARSPGAHDVTLHNVPSDDSYERYVTDALLVYSSAPAGTIVTTPRPHVDPTPFAK